MNSMSAILRFMFRYLILIFGEEWAKAKLDSRAAESEHAINAVCNSELAKFAEALRIIDSLYIQAADSVYRFPYAEDVITRILDQRLQALVRSINQTEQEHEQAA